MLPSKENRKLILGFSLAWLALIIASGLGLLIKTRLGSESEGVLHTGELLVLLARTQEVLTEAETGQRGYVVTADRDYVANYPKLKGRAEAYLSTIARLSRDNPDHVQRVKDLRVLIGAKFRFSSAIIRLMDEGDQARAVAMLRTKKGVRLMASVRHLIARMTADENLLLMERSNKANQTLRQTEVLIWVSFAVALVVGFITLLVFRRDAEARRLTAIALQDYASMLGGVFDSAESGIMVFKASRDPEGTVTDLRFAAINRRAYEIIGAPVNTMEGLLLLEVSPSHATNGLFDIYKDVIDTGQPASLEHREILRSGKAPWLSISAAAIQDGVAITFLDITQTKEAGQKLKQDEANLTALIENTLDEIWSIDNNLRLTTANTAFRRGSGAGLDLDIGKPIPLESLFGSEASDWHHHLTRALSGSRFILEIGLVRYGKTRTYDFSFNPISDGKGGVAGATIYGHDVTDRKKAELRIRQQSMVLNGILRNMPVVVFSYDASGKILRFTGAGMSKLGVQEGEVVGTSIFQALPMHAPEWRAALTQPRMHFLAEAPAGHDPAYYFDTYLFEDETGQAAVVGFSLDVTGAKRNETELAGQKLQAENANRAKTHFLANMSHEIRTPLSAIIGFADVLRQEDQDARHQEYLGHISSAGNTLLKLIGDILDLTKIEEGKMSMVEESFPLRETLSSVLYPYSFRAQELGLSFDLTFDGAMPTYAIGDAGKIIQIVINLVGNALKFTNRGGMRVVISAKDYEEADQQVFTLCIAVADSGIGIGDQQQGQVFDAFTQADAGISRLYGGSGLGLAIVRQMVGLLGGTIGIESPVPDPVSTAGGPGSQFTFSMPLLADTTRQAPSSIPERPLRRHYGGQMRVLVVEDNPVNQRLAGLILEPSGCVMDLASHGGEALAALHQQPPYHLIFMDVQMPVMDGLTAARAIREFDQQTPIVGLSANVYKEDIEACRDAGMNDFLAKPYTADRLLEMVARYAPVDGLVIQAPDPTQLLAPPVIETKPSSHTEASLAEAPTRLTSLEYLREITDDSAEDIREMLEAYVKVQDEFVALAQSYEPGNASPEDTLALARGTHKFKASAAMVGLMALQQDLSNLEADLKNHTAASPLIDHIIHTCHQAKAELSADLIRV